MPEVSSYSPGSFSWMELATSDQGKAKTFYSNLFGWNPNDQPMGPDQFYTMLEVQGKSVGALYGMDKDQLSRGVPPHWNLYISVSNVDDSTKKAESLGAKTIMQPFDVMDVGRMSVIQDPEGATVALWQAKSHPGAGLNNEPNAFCWYELYVHNTDNAKKFYNNLLGWGTKDSAQYTEWTQGGQSIGGMMQITPDFGGRVPPNWMAYVMVDDVNNTANKAKSLGGNVLMGPGPAGEMGHFAIIADPQGAVFGVYQPKK